MKNLTITITDAEFEKLGINKETLSFSELFEIIKDEISKQNLNMVTELAAKYGISEMSMDDINEEINAVAEPTENYGHAQSLSKQANTKARKKSIIQRIQGIRSDVALLRLEKVLIEMTVSAKTNTDVFKPTQKSIGIDQMIKLQKYKGIDAEVFETLTRELNISEPLDELIKSL